MYFRLFDIMKKIFKFILLKISRVIYLIYKVICRIKFYIIPLELQNISLLQKLQMKQYG